LNARLEIPRFRQTSQYFWRNDSRILIALQEHLLPQGAHIKTERSLQFENMVIEPLSARCSDCHRVFIAEPRSKERIDDLILWIRYAFDQHNCREDAGHAAES
jgi:hypothetical protein